jgi:hypothetical protein
MTLAAGWGLFVDGPVTLPPVVNACPLLSPWAADPPGLLTDTSVDRGPLLHRLRAIGTRVHACYHPSVCVGTWGVGRRKGGWGRVGVGVLINLLKSLDPLLHSEGAVKQHRLFQSSRAAGPSGQLTPAE